MLLMGQDEDGELAKRLNRKHWRSTASLTRADWGECGVRSPKLKGMKSKEGGGGIEDSEYKQLFEV